MQGRILSAGKAQGIVLGDDGVRYTFTPLVWQDSSVQPATGMRVEFEPRGQHAVSVSPLTTAVATQPTSLAPTASEGAGQSNSSLMPSPTRLLTRITGNTGSPGPSKSKRPASSGSANRRWDPRNIARAVAADLNGLRTDRRHWFLAGIGTVIVLVVVALAVFLIPLLSGPPEGKEVARHTHNGREYVLVDYGGDLAIFSRSGSPVSNRDVASQVLRSYAWRGVLSEFDVSGLVSLSRRVNVVDNRLDGIRSVSNAVVGVFDTLDGLAANVPLLGRISAMDLIRDSFDGVEEVEQMIRSLNTELNNISSNAAVLTNASGRLDDLNLASVSGSEMNSLFSRTEDAAADLAETARSTKKTLSDIRRPVAEFERALRSASDTPIIGDAIASSARVVGNFESQLSGLEEAMADFDSDLTALSKDMVNAIDSADKNHENELKDWLVEPYDSQWPPADDSSESMRHVTDKDTGGYELVAPATRSMPLYAA